MTRPDPLARALVDASLELHRHRLWLEVPGNGPFLVRVPGEEHALVASVMGHAGTEYGLSLFRGPQALARIARWVSDDACPPEEMEEASMLGVTIEPLGRIPPDLRGPLQAAGFQARREVLAPYFLAKPAHHLPRAPNRGEMRILLHALRGVLAAHDAGELEPPPLGPGARKVLEITVEGEGRKLEVRARTIPIPAASSTAQASLPVTLGVGISGPPGIGVRVKLEVGLRGLPRLGERWIVALPPLPRAIEGDERIVRGLLVLEERSKTMLAADIVLGAGDEEVAAKLAALFRGEARGGRRGLPREIVFGSERLADSLAPELAKLGVSVACDPRHPAIENLSSDLLEFFEHAAKPPSSTGQTSTGRLPRTLEEWKDADRDFTSRLCYEIEAGDLATARARARYFGSAEVAGEVLTELAPLLPFGAFVEWLVADYRASARSKPFLERALREGDWSEAEKALAKSRLEARLSIYRVDSAEPGATLEVEDVLTGARATVYDRALSGCGLEDYFVPLRLFEAGRYTFCAFAGPPLSAFDVDAALEELEALGLELSGAGGGEIRRSAHLFGRLWSFELHRRDHPPTLQNTDGDPLEFQTASFHVADGAALARELEARENVDRDEEAGCWVWSRPGGPVPGFGDTTTLARMEVIDDRLVLEVNSARRLARAREWIERIPGVRFEGSRAREAFSEETPMDYRLRGPPPKALSRETADDIERMFLARCRAWLDEEVPALGGLTPRAACATEEGRRRVAVLVRTMPPMVMPGRRVRAPVGEMMRELGIEAGR